MLLEGEELILLQIELGQRKMVRDIDYFQRLKSTYALRRYSSLGPEEIIRLISLVNLLTGTVKGHKHFHHKHFPSNKGITEIERKNRELLESLEKIDYWFKAYYNGECDREERLRRVRKGTDLLVGFIITGLIILGIILWLYFTGQLN